MRQRYRLVPAAILALALAAVPAAAKNISISISPTVTLESGTLTAQVRVQNSGDEAAQSVSPVFRFADKEARGDTKPALAPNESMTTSVSLPVGALGPGRWPFRLAIDYTDANQYPFEALHMGLLAVGNAPAAKVAVQEIKGGPLSGTSTLNVRVKNLAGTERHATVLLVAPEGIEVTKPTQELALAAWQEASLSAPMYNRTALAGSRYPVFVAVEYDDGGVHQAVISQGIVEIQAPQSFFQSQKQILWIGAGIVIAGWFGFVLWQLAARRPRRATPRA